MHRKAEFRPEPIQPSLSSRSGRCSASCRVCYIRHEYMRVALVHDWLHGMRGGEKVLESLLEIYPQATVFSLFLERGKVSPRLESHAIVTTWLTRGSGSCRHYRN